MQARLLTLVSVFLSLFFLATAVLAQEYVFESGRNNNITNIQTIESPEIEHYVYGVLSRGPDVADYYRLTFTNPTPNMEFSLLVIPEKNLTDFQPSLVVTDPNSTRMLGTAPFGFPQQVGGRVFSWPTSVNKETTDEKMREKFIMGPSVVKTQATGNVIVAVFDPEGRGGRYVLKLGVQKAQADWRDIFKFIGAFLRIKLRLY